MLGGKHLSFDEKMSWDWIPVSFTIPPRGNLVVRQRECAVMAFLCTVTTAFILDVPHSRCLVLLAHSFSLNYRPR